MPPIETDVAIIGAGPIGLFAVFELGLLDLKCHLVDILDRPGGQCTELYPEKPIYDIPGLPIVTGQELTNRCWNRSSRSTRNSISARWRRRWRSWPTAAGNSSTDAGTEIDRASGGDRGGRGQLRAQAPAGAGHRGFENAGDGVGVHYAVRKMETFRGKNILIAGGGDSALDWTINLAPLAKSLTLVHHRDGFRAAQHSVNQMRELEKEGKVKFHVASVKALHGEAGKLSGVTLAGADKNEWHHEADAFLPFFGLTIKLGPIAEFGINLHENLIPVDTARFESQTPGIFAIGDINTYTGKLKLILSGFHEAALMAQAAFHIARPNEKLRFQYTTSSSSLQKKLGVS